MVTVTVELSDGLANLGNLGKETIREGMSKTSQDLIRNLQIKSPVDHGLLKQWAVTSESDMEVTIQSPAIYAAYQNYGTSEHWIEPFATFALHWGGSPGFFSKGHFVKGIEGKHFVEDSIEETQSRISEFFTINGG
jgi:hypothetical protein